MASWPAGLPQVFTREGLGVDWGNNVARFDPEIGPPMTRRRGSSAPQIVTGSMVLTEAQYATFTTFYETTLKHGADTFTWAHPVDASSATMLFDGQPQLTSIGGGHWRLFMSLLILQ